MKQLNIPAETRRLLDEGATLVISISGGKDSQALLSTLRRAYEVNNWTGELLAVHADLGRMEWHQTPEVIEDHAARYDIPLEIVTRADGLDLVGLIERRAIQLQGTGRPFWPSSAARYCTSDMKRAPIDKLLRKFRGVVICAMGLRAEESPARAKKAVWEARGKGRLNLKDGSRTVYDWNPIHDWTEVDVWEELGGRTGPGVHPAYGLGNQRLSCALCVLACKSDLANGAANNPELYSELVRLEDQYGSSFKNNWSLRELELPVLQ